MSVCFCYALEKGCLARNQAIKDHKTLIFASPADRRITEPLYPLQMDDATYMLMTFGLQRDSEFLQAFNYYLLKANEHGILRRIYRDKQVDIMLK